MARASRFVRSRALPARRAGSRLFLRQAGLAQPGEISGVVEGADLLYSPGSGCPQAGKAGKTAVATEPTGFGDFRSSAIGVSIERIGGGEMTVGERQFRIGAE